jgi:hypothetical protein
VRVFACLPCLRQPNVRQWTIYNKAARRRQHNLKTYWTIHCSRMLKYSIQSFTNRCLKFANPRGLELFTNKNAVCLLGGLGEHRYSRWEVRSPEFRSEDVGEASRFQRHLLTTAPCNEHAHGINIPPAYQGSRLTFLWNVNTTAQSKFGNLRFQNKPALAE